MSINSVVNDTVTGESVVNALKPKPPAISGYAISGADDTALDPAGGQTILLNGTGFQRGATVTLNGTAVAVVSYVNANQLSFTSPAQSAGTYTIYAVNADGGTGIYIPGLIYSNLPTWTTGAGSLGSYYETKTIASNVVATGDAPVTYSLFSGALPTGAVFNANGSISGTAPADSGSTTYSFTVQATDAQLQDSTRSFTLTINTDVVSWVSPASGATIELTGVPYSTTLSATSAAGYSIAGYTANTLPTGITLSGNTVSGTPTTSGTTTTLLTATAATTGRSATRTISWVISIGDPNWKYTTLLLPGASTVFNQDASANNFGLTVTGSVQASNFSPFSGGTATDGSAVFASGGYLSIPASSQFAIASGDDFCLEMWVYYTATPGGYSFMFSMGDGTNALSFRTGDSGFQYKIQAEFGPSTVGSLYDNASYTRSNLVNKWSHLVLCRASGTASFFFDGTRIATKGSTVTLGTASGSINTASPYHFEGYASNVRFVKGSAVYNPAASSITVPTTPLTAIANTRLLALQNNQPANNNTFFDNSANKLAITRNGNTTQGTFSPYGGNWSNYFDGNGDYLSVTGTALDASTTTDYTVEFWMYTAKTASAQMIYELGTGVTNDLQIYVSTTALVFQVDGNSPSATVSFSDNTWVHVACVKSNTTLTTYINGVGTTVDTGVTVTSKTTAYIGMRAGASLPFTGYLSNMRVTRAAVYTANFTPSTTPLTPTTTTSLLICQSNRLIDNSANNFAITKAGDVSVQRYSPFNPVTLTSASYSWNLYTLGSYQVTRNSTLSSLSTGAFTVEGWYYPTSSISSQNARILSLGRDSVAAAGDTSWDLYISNGSALVWQRIQTTATTYSANYTFNLNTWYHVVACRDSSSNLALFVNGTRILLQANVTTNYDYVAGSNNYHYIGASYNNVAWSYALGYYSNIRVIKGATAYDPTQTTLTVPTTPLTATAQTSMLLFGNNGSELTGNYPLTSISRIDSQSTMVAFNPFGSTSATTNGYTVSTIGGSGYFDGSGDSLQAPSSASISGTGDFTAECWIYPTTVPGTYNVIGCSDTSGGLTMFGLNSNGTIFMGRSLIDVQATTSNSLSYNTWNHIAISRSSGTVRLFINGIQGYSGSITTNYNAGTVRLGTDGGGSSLPYAGYISNFRIITNSAIYTSNFVPSLTPLTAVQNTTLLINMTNAGIYDASTLNNIETVGDARLSTAVTKWGATSLSFDGSGDRLVSPPSPINILSSGDFTIEFWLYPSNTSVAYRALVSSENYPATTGGWSLYQNGTAIEFWMNGSASAIINATSAITAGTWQHLALCRASGTLRLFKDGTSISSVSHSTSMTGQQIWIGDNNSSGGGLYFYNGYIDDLRITRGLARYTANFTPPIEAFQIK